jgi:Tfp pilus assembly protein PilV
MVVGTPTIKSSGFSLAEILLAMGLAAVALLALVGQNTLLLSSNQKQDDTSVANDVAYSIIEQVSSEFRYDPAVRTAAFGHNSVINPFREDTVTVGNTDYSYELFLSDVQDTASGSAVGSGATGVHTTRLKKAEIVVTWWGQEKQGMGKLEIKGTRFVKVSDA